MKVLIYLHKSKTLDVSGVAQIIYKSMTRAFLLNAICMSTAIAAFGQVPVTRCNNSIDVGAAIGSLQGSFTTTFVHNWRFGNKQKLEAGFGGRFITYESLLFTVGANIDLN